MSNYGAQDMVSPLRRVMMHRPGPAQANADPGRWHYAGALTLEHLQDNHQALVKHIRADMF